MKEYPREAMGTSGRRDWRLEIPEPRRRPLRAWLWSVAGMTLGVLIVGGITRLTQSGLSIVDWEPLFGVIPPLTEAQWQETFDRYRQFPEYQKLRQGMTLSEFQFIFFWEFCTGCWPGPSGSCSWCRSSSSGPGVLQPPPPRAGRWSCSGWARRRASWGGSWWPAASWTGPASATSAWPPT
jgi:hypothetical protein